MPYIYRTVKGAPLTHAEYDENFAYTEELFEDIEAARDVTVSASSFKGRWSDQTGSASIPFSVAHDGYLWGLLEDLADVTASEPSDANTDWQLLIGTAGTKNFGTDPGEIPLNSDLPTFGTVATKDHGTAAGEVPLNSDLGTASTKDTGVAVGNVVEIELDDSDNPGLPAISGEQLTHLSHPIYEIFNATPAATYPPLYACRAWCHYNATTTTIEAHGNIDSVTDHGAALFTFNFDTDMPDENYVVVASTGGTENGNLATGATLPYAYSAGAFNMTTGATGGTRANRERTCIAVFR